MNEEVDAFVKQHAGREVRRWRASAAHRERGLGVVAPPASLAETASGAHHVAEEDGGFADRPDEWTSEPEGTRRSGLISMFYSFRRARSWMPLRWQLPGGAGVFADLPVRLWGRNPALQAVGSLAQFRSWLGLLRKASAPPKWFWAIAACALRETPLPSLLWL